MKNQIETQGDLKRNLAEAEEALAKLPAALAKSQKLVEAAEVDALIDGKPVDPKLKRAVIELEARQSDLENKARVIKAAIRRIVEQEEANRDEVRYNLRQQLIARLAPENAELFKAFQAVHDAAERWAHVVDDAEFAAIKATGRGLAVNEIGLVLLLFPAVPDDPKQDYYQKESQHVLRAAQIRMFESALAILSDEAAKGKYKPRA